MNPRTLNRASLVDFVTNAATGVADGKITGFLAEQNTAFSDSLTDANAILAAADLNQVEARTASKESTRIAEDAYNAVLTILSDLKFGMKSVESPAAD